MQKPSLGYLHVVANWVLADSHGDCCVPTWKLVVFIDVVTQQENMQH